MDLQMILDAINALGSMGVLVVFAVLFVRGEIISRKVLDEIIARLTSEVMARTIAAVDDIVERRLEALKADLRNDLRNAPQADQKLARDVREAVVW